LGHKKAHKAHKYVLLVLALLFALAPVYWMLTISLKSDVDQFASPPPWFGFTPTLEHYYDAFVTRGFGRYLLTSAIVSVASTLCALVIGTLAAYALARFSYRGDSTAICRCGYFPRACFRRSLRRCRCF
jgi:multiple sugar transport system permease protein